MIFSDTTTKLGLIQDCEMNIFGNYGDISSNSDRLYDFTARLNRAYDKVATMIMSLDGRWSWDDTNYTDSPIGSTNLVSGQKDYGIDVEFMDIQKVIVLDSNGNKSVIYPYDIKDQGANFLLEKMDSDNTGIPTRYLKRGGSIYLDPIPNYSYSAGLIIYYQRKPSYFTYTDTTKSVGIPSTLHRWLSLEASFDYAISKQLSLKNDIKFQLDDIRNLASEFYNKRTKDEQLSIIPIIRNNR
jgi:hypothetical protein